MVSPTSRSTAKSSTVLVMACTVVAYTALAYIVMAPYGSDLQEHGKVVDGIGYRHILVITSSSGGTYYILVIISTSGVTYWLLLVVLAVWPIQLWPIYLWPYMIGLPGASDMLVEVLGDRGKHARTCIGAGSCPAAVTVEMIVRVKD